MAGVGYTFAARSALTTASIVVGPAWQTLRAPSGAEDAVALAWRPSISVSVPVGWRLSATASAGYVWTRPVLTHLADNAATRGWPIDAFVVSGGVVVRLF